MKIPDDSVCKVCKKFFCCAKCRHKHEIKSHAIPAKITRTTMNNSGRKITTSETLYLLCPICEQKALPLQQEIHGEMLKHVEKCHLPLHCQKCAKVYNKIEDLKEFSKCVSAYCNDQEEAAYRTYDTESSKSTVTHKAPTSSTISTQTSPMPSHSTDRSQTPSSGVDNIPWKCIDGKPIRPEDYISDSVSSIKNLSSINNSSSLRRSLDLTTACKGKLVRSTSTPLQLEVLIAKPKEQCFNASGVQVSSIYNSSGEPHSSAIADGTPQIQRPQLDNLQRYRKIAGRPKMAAVTPLRQVMSKSIQKAFAEHGGLPSSAATYQRKKMFESIEGASVEFSNDNTAESPLDLRLSPAVRRSRRGVTQTLDSRTNSSSTSDHSKGGQIRREILLSAQKVTTESIVITRTQHLTAAPADGQVVISNTLSSMKQDSNNNHSTANQLSYSSSGSSSCGGNGSSVYKTCHSVEIFTSTELSELNLQQNDVQILQENQENAADRIHSARAIILPSHSHKPEGCTLSAPFTPKCIYPNAVINKKIIKFDTPAKVEAEICEADSPSATCEAFFTPCATPLRKAEDSASRKGMPRNLSGHFSPSRKPPLKSCALSPSFSRMENTENRNSNEPYSSAQGQTQSQPPQTGASSWTLSSFMSSFMRIPSLANSSQMKSSSSDAQSTDNSNSLLKRCASIAGSLIRSKPFANDEQFKAMKRKRTYTSDCQTATARGYVYASPPSPNTVDHTASGASKRFRIHGRKPIRPNLNYF